MTSAILLKRHKHAVHSNKSPNLIEKQKRITFFLNASNFSTSPAADPADIAGKPVSSDTFTVSEDTGLYEVCSVVTAT